MNISLGPKYNFSKAGGRGERETGGENDGSEEGGGGGTPNQVELCWSYVS